RLENLKAWVNTRKSNFRLFPNWRKFGVQLPSLFWPSRSSVFYRNLFQHFQLLQDCKFSANGRIRQAKGLSEFFDSQTLGIFRTKANHVLIVSPASISSYSTNLIEDMFVYCLFLVNYG